MKKILLRIPDTLYQSVKIKFDTHCALSGQWDKFGKRKSLNAFLTALIEKAIKDVVKD